MHRQIRDTDGFYISAIKTAINGAHDIRTPSVKGGVCRVYFADTEFGPTVFRFSSKELTEHNTNIGKLLHQKGISAPLSNVHTYSDLWFETYRYNPDETLFETINTGIDKQQIKNIYNQLINIQIKMSEIPLTIVPLTKLSKYPDLFQAMSRFTLPPLLSSVYTNIIKTVLLPGKKRLVHNDLNPKNVLITPDKNVSGILDLDSVGISNENFAMMMLMRYYPFVADYGELLDYYEDNAKRNLHRHAILMGLKTLAKVRNTRRKLEDLMRSSVKSR